MHYHIITLYWIHLDEQFLLTNNVLNTPEREGLLSFPN